MGPFLIFGAAAAAVFLLTRKKPRPKTITVEVDGDSIVWGPTLAANICTRLREWRPSWTVDDRGVYGLKLWQLIVGYQEPYPGCPPDQFPRGPQPPFVDVERSSHFIVLELGGNDALEMRTPAEFEADLRSAISTVQAEGRVPVLTGIVGIPVGDIFTPPILVRLAELNAITHQVAEELGLQHACWGEDYRGPQDTFDGVHRTQEASDRLAVLLMQALERAAN